MEIELILQFILIFSLGLCVGLPFSSRLGTKHLKEHVRFLEGKINRAKQDKKSDDGGILGDLLGGGLNEKTIMKILGNLSPEQIQKGKEVLSGLGNNSNQGGATNEWR